MSVKTTMQTTPLINTRSLSTLGKILAVKV